MTRPAHRPPKHVGGYVGAVSRHLAIEPATRRQLAVALGYSPSAIEKAVYALRAAGAPELQNLRMGTSGPIPRLPWGAPA